MKKKRKHSKKINSPLAFLKRSNLLAIDIGRDQTKVVVGRAKPKRTGYTFYIQKFFSFPTPKKPEKDTRFMIELEEEQDSLLFDQEEFRNQLNEKMKNLRIKTKKVVLTIEDNAMISREFILPLAKKEEMESVVMFETEQHLPINMNEYTIQYKIIEKISDEEGENARVLVCALPKKIGEQHYTFLQSMNLKPMALDTHSNGIAKFFESNFMINGISEDSKEMTIAVVDLGHGQMNLSIIEKGVIKFNRLLEGGGKDLDEQIAASFNLSMQEAIWKKKDLELDISIDGIPSFTEEAMLQQIVKSTIDTWLQDIQRMFNYYTSRDRNNKIDRIYLIGGSSKFKGLPEYIENMLEIPTERIKEMKQIQIKQKTGAFDSSDYFNTITTLIRK